MKYVPPSTSETAFNCPHCGALAKQTWYKLRAEPEKNSAPLPLIARESDDRDWEFNEIDDVEMRKKLRKWGSRMLTGRPFFTSGKDNKYHFQTVNNLAISSCFNCDDISIWIYDKLIYPQQGEAPSPNPEMPIEIRKDYLEASSILAFSPRGAAALLRLGIQKLCKELGEPGRNINEDIGALVSKGLNPRVQKALDAVRVIGNEAVHPGEIDLRDDRATAEVLFGLVNLIVEKMISEPKHVDEVYAKLPKRKLEAIKKRDKS
ncbi:MAG: DUF4145 domain-containing protein [Cognatishimia sp.]|uniref:DUF4145 domain-containing protein n=1 Tax=Cognatishimia sp. TaxID=2211648 RepID=UPI003B8B4030